MQLQHVEPDEISDLPNLNGVLVDEHTDNRGAERESFDYCFRLLWRHAPVGWAEVKAQQVRARLDREPRAVAVADAADLHLDGHADASSVIRAAGSSARISDSPTRIASAPASRMRRACSLVRIPLSATRT